MHTTPIVLDLSVTESYIGPHRNMASGVKDELTINAPEGQSELEQEKQEEIRKFKERVGREDDLIKGKKMRSMNIAVIGCPGVGKSSIVNTVMTSFSDDCWRERAVVGNYGLSAQQVTHTLLGHSKEDYIKSRHDKSYNFPTLIDIAGFDDVNNEVNKELLRIILFGRLPEEEKLIDAVNYNQDYGLQGLRQKYCENEENLKVDRVIVVASAKANTLPKNLLEAVNQVAQKEGRVIPLFGILTHKDCIDESSSDFQEKVEDFRSSLGINDSRYLLCTNYCDAYDRECGRSRMEGCHPELDIPVLKFMRQVCDPSRRIIKERMNFEQATGTTPPVRQIDPERDQLPAVLENDTRQDLLIGAVKVVLITILLVWYLSPVIDGKSLSEDCSKYEQYRQSSDLRLKEFEKICGIKYELTQLHIFWPLFFCLVIFGIDGIRVLFERLFRGG